MSNVNWKPFVFGGLASVTAECGTFPIDLTKTRLQVQGQVGDRRYREIRYRGMLHAIMRIGKEEGPRALYSGIAPAMLRQASYGTIKIGTYQSFKRLLVDRPEDETLLTNVACGILSGVISSSIANPTDVLKIRMQAQGNVIQGSMMGNFINIYQQEGTRGLWKGVSLTAQRAAIVVGVELPVYDITKKHLILSGYMGDTVYTHFLSSFVCGLAGALASNPVDVVRTRMMNQRGGALYQGTLDCLLQLKIGTSCGHSAHHLYAFIRTSSPAFIASPLPTSVSKSTSVHLGDLQLAPLRSRLKSRHVPRSPRVPRHQAVHSYPHRTSRSAPARPRSQLSSQDATSCCYVDTPPELQASKK